MFLASVSAISFADEKNGEMKGEMMKEGAKGEKKEKK
jgi:hypothetical protein